MLWYAALRDFASKIPFETFRLRPMRLLGESLLMGRHTETVHCHSEWARDRNMLVTVHHPQCIENCKMHTWVFPFYSPTKFDKHGETFGESRAKVFFTVTASKVQRKQPNANLFCGSRRIGFAANKVRSLHVDVEIYKSVLRQDFRRRSYLQCGTLQCNPKLD